MFKFFESKIKEKGRDPECSSSVVSVFFLWREPGEVFKKQGFIYLQFLTEVQESPSAFTAVSFHPSVVSRHFALLFPFHFFFQNQKTKD